MSFFDRIFGRTQTKLAEAAEQQLLVREQQLRNNQELFTERLAELELALEDQGWRRIVNGFEREFSREGLRAIMKMSRLMFLKNPLINRAVSLQAVYVWGQGVQVTSSDEAVQELVNEFMSDPKNQCELTGHQARTMKEQDLQVLGNVFFTLFSALDTGNTVVRTIPPEEIDEIICNPEDAREPWFYKRTWTSQVTDIASGMAKSITQTAYYPDIRYEPADRPPTIGGKPVKWDSPVYHVRVGGLSDQQFGVPETYQAIDWARAYNASLEDYATLKRAHARFAFKLSSEGGKAGIAAAKDRLNTTLGNGASAESNPPTTVASTFIAGKGTDIAAVKTAGMVADPEEGRRLLLMVCAAFGMPESFFGDVSVGTLATAKSLDRPTELKFRDRQELWKSVLDTILQYVIAKSKRAAGGKLRLVGKMEPVPLQIDFPPILEHDVTEQVNAIVMAATLDGKPSANTIDDETLSKLILTALGVPNIPEVLDAIAKQQAEDEAKAKAIAKQQAPPASQQDPGVAEALREFREALARFVAKAAA